MLLRLQHLVHHSCEILHLCRNTWASGVIGSCSVTFSVRYDRLYSFHMYHAHIHRHHPCSWVRPSNELGVRIVICLCLIYFLSKQQTICPLVLFVNIMDYNYKKTNVVVLLTCKCKIVIVVLHHIITRRMIFCVVAIIIKNIILRVHCHCLHHRNQMNCAHLYSSVLGQTRQCEAVLHPRGRDK